MEVKVKGSADFPGRPQYRWVRITKALEPQDNPLARLGQRVDMWTAAVSWPEGRPRSVGAAITRCGLTPATRRPYGQC